MVVGVWEWPYVSKGMKNIDRVSCVCVCLQSLNTPLYVSAKTACERYANEKYMEPSRHTLNEFMGVFPPRHRANK